MTPAKNHKNPGDRIAKVLARAGVCSRREAERWIAEGRVSVNGKVLESPACVVTDSDRIEVDGNPLQTKEKTRLFLFHKPTGTVTTAKDEKDRKTIYDVLPKDLPRLITVGRLDMNTEGLLLLTNDGELARYLELPATGLVRCYRVRVHGNLNEEKAEKIRTGITFKGVRYQPADITIERQQGSNSWALVTLTEGKNREVRNLMEAVGCTVNRLIRTAYGPFELGNLDKGGVVEIKDAVLKDKLKGYFQ